MSITDDLIDTQPDTAECRRDAFIAQREAAMAALHLSTALGIPLMPDQVQVIGAYARLMDANVRLADAQLALALNRRRDHPHAERRQGDA